MKYLLLSLAVLAVVLDTTRAAATESLPGSTLPDVEPPPAPQASPKPSPYSLPWSLRPAVAVSAVRSDTVVALQDSSQTVVSLLSASLRLVPDLALSARYGWVHDAPDSESSRSALTNLALGALYAPKIATSFRLALSGGVVVPLAQGGGSTPAPSEQRAIGSAAYARSAMDNAMFAPNDLSLFAGVGLAYVADGFTVQLETTFFYLKRVKGDALQPDSVKTNTTWGAHVGYFILPELSIGAELRYQMYLAPPLSIRELPERRDTSTAAIGARLHFNIGEHSFHPGLSYAHPLDNPMSAAGYRIVQLDLPFVF